MRCGVYFHEQFTANLLLSVPAKQFRKSLSILYSNFGDLTFYKVARCITERPRNLLREYYDIICSPSCACQLYLTVLRLCLFCDYRDCGSIPHTNHNFPDHLTNVKFPDFLGFSRWLATTTW